VAFMCVSSSRIVFFSFYSHLIWKDARFPKKKTSKVIVIGTSVVIGLLTKRYQLT
jgi:hypothetical protein